MFQLHNIFKYFPVVLIWLASFYSVSGQTLVINEVMFLNESVLSDQFGNHPAWIELYNGGNAAVELNNYYLSNSPFEPKRWRIPVYQLQPGGYIVIFASGESITSAEPFHTNFEIVNFEHRVFLYHDNGDEVDASPGECVPTNRSIARLPDGFDDWVFPSHYSPGETNNTAYADGPDDPAISLAPSHPSGYYGESIDLNIDVEGDYDVRYTLNTGASPQSNSALLEGPLNLSGRENDPNVFSNISTTNQAVQYEPPEGYVNKAHVIRAAAFSEGCPVSQIFTGNYLVDPGSNGFKYPADVVFVNTAPDNLFSETKGIHVFGNDANYTKRGDLWERPANIEFFDAEGVSYLKQDGGIRIHGGGTREGPQKSIRLYARDDYGHDSFNYPFFEDRELTSYKRLILRMSMGDWTGTLFKDHLCHHLIQDLEVSYMSGKVSVVFLNGEYWGVFNLRERQDQHYVESHFGADDDNLDMVEYSLFHKRPLVEEGDMDRYDSLIDFLEHHDIRDPENYEQVIQWIDISNFIDQYITQLYFANTDFPGNNNTLWRSRSDNGIWRWLFYDCDACMVRPQSNHLAENVEGGQQFSQQPEWSMIIFRALLRNELFKGQFASRFRTLLNSTFNAGRVLAIVDEFEESYGPLVAEHIHRWHNPNDYNEWLTNVQGIRQFAIERPVALTRVLERYFGQPMQVVPNPNVGNFELRFSGESRLGLIELYDSRGQLLESNKYGSELKTSIHFGVDLPDGIYLIKAEINGRYYTDKIVISQ